jgi:hypothetical protein
MTHGPRTTSTQLILVGLGFNTLLVCFEFYFRFHPWRITSSAARPAQTNNMMEIEKQLLQA